ncbi:MAG: hypothetical protein ABJA67_09280 [Chthonomonadales bacterium]
MGIRPEDKQKAMAIGAMLVAVVIYFVVFVIPKLTAPAEKTGKSSSGSAATSGPTTQVAAQVGALVPQNPESKGSDLYADYEPNPAAGRDPFTALHVAPDEAVKIARATANPLPSMGSNFGGANNAGMKVMPIGAPNWPAIELQGVMPGDPAMAVLKIGDQVYLKHAGDRLDAGVIISRITESGVTLKLASRTMVLDIGHSTQIERPGATPATNPAAVPPANLSAPVTPSPAPGKSADGNKTSFVETRSHDFAAMPFRSQEPSTVAIAMSEGDQAGLGSNQMISTRDAIGAELLTPAAKGIVAKRRYRRRRVIHHAMATKQMTHVIPVIPIGPRPPS